MTRFTNDPDLNALDDIRRMVTRIELELQQEEPEIDTVKKAARTIRVVVSRFTRWKGFE